MFTFRHPVSWALALIVTALVSLAFCSTGHVSEVSSALLSATGTRAPKGPAPVTVKAEPGTLAIDGNRIARQVLDVEYRILEPASVTNATLVLEGPEGGVLAEMPVPIQASGRVRFDIDAPKYTVAPVMRFRAAVLKLRIKGTGPTRATTAVLPFQESGVASK